MTEVHEALRRWAKGLYPLEAGVELLIQSFDGRSANPSQPWVQQGDDPGWWWIDAGRWPKTTTAHSRAEKPPAPHRRLAPGWTACRPQPQPRRPRPRTPPTRPRAPSPAAATNAVNSVAGQVGRLGAS